MPSASTFEAQAIGETGGEPETINRVQHLSSHSLQLVAEQCG